MEKVKDSIHLMGGSKSRFQKGHTQSNTGKTHFKLGEKRKISEETKLKLSQIRKGIPHLNQRGEKCYLWKGGITKEKHKISTTTLNQYGKQPGTSRFFKVFEQIINAHKKVHQTLENTEFLKRLNAVVLEL